MKSKKFILFAISLIIFSGCSDAETAGTLETLVGTWEVENIKGEGKKGIPNTLLRAQITFHEDGTVSVNALHKEDDGTRVHQETQNYRIDKEKLFMTFLEAEKKVAYKLEDERLVIQDPKNDVSIYFKRIEN